MSFDDLMDTAKGAIQDGELRVARPLLLRAVRRQPDRDEPWLLLADVAATSEEALGFLRKALAINPENQQTEDRLEAAEYLAAEDESWRCPVCGTPATIRSIRCAACKAVVSLADFRAFSDSQQVDRAVLLDVIASLQEPKTGPEERQRLKTLALAALNLGRQEEGLRHLEAAVELNPHDVLLKAHTTALGRRLRELGEIGLGEEDSAGSQGAVSCSRDDRPAAVARSTAAQGPVAKRFVLLVDDSPTLCKLVEATLSRRGYGVIVAPDGVDALAIVHDFRPDLALVDVSMPHLDGFGLCKSIKAQGLAGEMPIVMLTAKGQLLDRIRGRALGAVDHLVKPVTSEVLLKKVAELLEAESSAEDETVPPSGSPARQEGT